MIFKELLKKSKKLNVLQYIANFADEQLKKDKYRIVYGNIFNELYKAEPVQSTDGEFTIYVRKMLEDDAELDAYLIDTNGYSYCFSLTKWEEILSYTVNEIDVQEVGIDTFVAEVLWEMTFWGFDQKTIQDFAKSLDSNFTKSPESEGV